MSKISDEEILSKIKNDKTADQGFALLMEKYQEKTYWQIRRILLDHENTNDVMQNTFIKVWKNINKFRSDSRLYTWIYRIATNEAISFIKSNKSKYCLSIDEMSEDFGEQLQSDVHFDGTTIQRKLQLAIATLPNRQKMVFNMRYFDAMSYQDIADVIGVSIGTLKASYHIAAKKIELFLKEN
ncbi:MAG: sigma-70 family RNA polymerase sigma factor [Bacteroidales bacterium]|nr:sigma-70 family RNA polymerase sigma factor [Bacteroidales bacterium]